MRASKPWPALLATTKTTRKSSAPSTFTFTPSTKTAHTAPLRSGATATRPANKLPTPCMTARRRGSSRASPSSTKSAATNSWKSENRKVKMGTSNHSGVIERRSEEHTSELQSLTNLVCRLLLEKKKTKEKRTKALRQ